MIRSLLFVPGNSPAMLQNADIHGADALILDLEDAVALKEKDGARALVKHAVKALNFGGLPLVIRVNPLGSPYLEDDLLAMVPLRPAYLMPTKVSGAGDIQRISARMAEIEASRGMKSGCVGLLPLIETALGVENAFRIASSDPRVQGMLLGAEDLASDLGAARSKAGREIFYARGRMVMAARAAGILVFDTPFTDVDDEEGLEKDAGFAKSLGFDGKAAISPRHVAAINLAFSPTVVEINYAREVMAAIPKGEEAGLGVVSLHGKMVDKPIVERAKRVLAAARQLGLEGEDE
ncbi:MAG: aldolase/citrate lyase family protein [Eubacteriales bacterium]|nr:aldolase/citrate lyase family protein [Eubacteriales bacterium]